MARVGSTLALVTLASALAMVGSTVDAQTVEPQSAASQAKQPRPSGAATKAAATKDAKSTASDTATNKAKDPATIQKSLETAQKSLDAGKADLAITQINGLVSGGGLDARSMARALAVRGHAHKKQGKPAQAIADLQSALWLKGGLNDAERAAATQARVEAYREAGLGEAPSANQASVSKPAAAVPSALEPTQPARRAEAKSTPISTATVPRAEIRPDPTGSPAAPTPAPQSSGGIGSFFSNLFGGSGTGGGNAPAPAATSPVKAPADPAVSSWSETAPSFKSKATHTRAASVTPSAPDASPSAAPTTKTAVASAAPGKAGAYKLQLAAVRSHDEAKSVAERVRKEHGDAIRFTPIRDRGICLRQHGDVLSSAVRPLQRSARAGLPLHRAQSQGRRLPSDRELNASPAGLHLEFPERPQVPRLWCAYRGAYHYRSPHRPVASDDFRRRDIVLGAVLL